jgi:hypothetical protein
MLVRQVQQSRQFALEQRALWLVTSSDIVPLRLEPVAGVDPQTHATYRARPGESLAVFTFSNFAPAGPGQTYRIWARTGQGWINLGNVPLDEFGNGRLVIENPAFATTPVQLEVTLEPTGNAAQEPSEAARVIVWPAVQ